MKKVILVVGCFAVATACGSEKETPVDMTYKVSVTTEENTCGDYAAPEDVTVVVDAVLQPDGRVTFRNSSGWIPGDREYTDIGVFDGKVDHTLVVPWVGNVNFTHTIKGTMTQEGIDILLSVEKRKPGTDEFVRCKETVHIKGERRALWDPSQLDGKYRAKYTYYGQICQGDTPVVVGSWNVPLDINPYGRGLTTLDFDEMDERIIFDLEIEDSGAVDYQGTLLFIVSYGFAEFDLRATGTVSPGLVDISLKYSVPGDTSGCYYRLDARGGKLLLSPGLDDNYFRASARKTDECLGGDEFLVEDFIGDAVTVSQDSGEIFLLFGGVRANLKRDGQRIHNVFTSNYGNHTLTYEGLLAPPVLEFSIVYRYDIGTEYECEVRFEADAYVRYYLPDEGSGYGEFSSEMRSSPDLFEGGEWGITTLIHPDLLFISKGK